MHPTRRWALLIAIGTALMLWHHLPWPGLYGHDHPVATPSAVAMADQATQAGPVAATRVVPRQSGQHSTDHGPSSAHLLALCMALAAGALTVLVQLTPRGHVLLDTGGARVAEVLARTVRFRPLLSVPRALAVLGVLLC